MTKSDDSGLDPEQRRAVEIRAKLLLDRAAAWERFPTPIEDILEAAKITVAPKNVFDPAQIMAYLRRKASEAAAAAANLKSAIAKVFGIYDTIESVIHIDETVVKSKQTFLKLHETGHHEIPTHRKMFRFFQDCDQCLSPDIADLFEREANNFARYALFQGNKYSEMAGDYPLAIKTPMDLAKKFGASIYASCREFARTNHRACAVYVLEPVEFVDGVGASAKVRRVEVSPSFELQFSRPNDQSITLNHDLGKVLPIGRRMSKPTSLMMRDLNGNPHECIAEAFDTKYNVIILLYPRKALAAPTIIIPQQARTKNLTLLRP